MPAVKKANYTVCNVLFSCWLYNCTRLLYSDTCLSWTSIGPTFIYVIDRCLIYTVKKDFLRQDFIKSLVYTGFRFIQGLVKTSFIVLLKRLIDRKFVFCNFKQSYRYIELIGFRCKRWQRKPQSILWSIRTW